MMMMRKIKQTSEKQVNKKDPGLLNPTSNDQMM